MTATTDVRRTSRTATADAAPTRRRRRDDTRSAMGFMAPFLILYVLFVIGPAMYGLVMSFFDTSLVKSGLGKFAGFSNYVEAFKSSDFWSSMWHTVWFTVLTTPPLVILSFVFALLAERATHGKWFFRLAFFSPYILPSATVALIWIWLYTPDLGLASGVVKKFGVTAPQWLGDPHWAMWSIAATTVWWTLGFNFVLYLAGLQEIPRELYESSALDGATPWQQMRIDHDPAAEPDDDAGGRPADHRLAQGLRPDVHHDLGRAELQHPSGARVHLRHRLHRLPRGLRRRRVDGLLRPPADRVGGVVRPDPALREKGLTMATLTSEPKQFTARKAGSEDGRVGIAAVQPAVHRAS